MRAQVFKKEKVRVRPRRNSQIAPRRPRTGISHSGAVGISGRQVSRRKESREADSSQMSPNREPAKVVSLTEVAPVFSHPDISQANLSQTLSADALPQYAEHHQHQPSLEMTDIELSLEASIATKEVGGAEGKGGVTFDLKEVSSDFSTTISSTSTPARDGPSSRLRPSSTGTDARTAESSIVESQSVARTSQQLLPPSTGDD